MRIATQQIYSQNVDTMQRQQAELLHTQQQLSTGQRMLTPSDDPVAAAQALRTTQVQALGQQYARNMDTAKSRLQMTDSAMSSIANLYESARTSLVQAGDTSLSDSDRAAIAQTLEADFQQLMGMANMKDSSGSYLFGGNRDTAQPYSQTAAGAAYNGDQGQRLLQVASSRQIPVGENGANLFERIPTGNGVFATSGAASNAGSGVIGPGSVIDPSALTGHAYQLVFHNSAGAVTYDVLDTTLGTTLSSASAFPADGNIAVAGMQLSITGSPADGDTFNAVPSVNQGVFTTLRNAITVLQTPANSTASRAQLSMAVAQAICGLDNAADQMHGSRAKVGASLAELDMLGSANSSQDVIYSQQLTTLEDVDYAKAASDLSAGQLSLQAAQQSYALISKLSLFDYL